LTSPLVYVILQTAPDYSDHVEGGNGLTHDGQSRISQKCTFLTESLAKGD